VLTPDKRLACSYYVQCQFKKNANTGFSVIFADAAHYLAQEHFYLVALLICTAAQVFLLGFS